MAHGFLDALRRLKNKFRHRRHSPRPGRVAFFEPLEARLLLNARPMPLPDPFYYTAENTALTVTTFDITLLDNDGDPEGSSLTASVVDHPSHGTLSNFSGSQGTFTYTPDTSYVGLDGYTYQVSDGTDDSHVVSVSIAVGGHFGPRTNQEHRTRSDLLQSGQVLLREPLTPGLALLYNSGTLPQPIIVVETFLQPGSDVPDEILAQLTFNSSAGTSYSYETTGLAAGDSLRFALQADATALSTGRYDYSVKLTADVDSNLVDHFYAGDYDVVNRGSSTYAFGRGWQLEGLDQLFVGSGGVLWVQSAGDAYWFPEDGGGGFDPAEGDLSFSTLVENVDDTFTLTDKHGIVMNFDAGGKLTARVDRNDNTFAYAWSSGLLSTITDPFDREISLSYTNGRLTSITDFASRTATLTYDGSGRLASITQVDPDGAGPLGAPVTEFAYDASSHLH